MEGQNVVMLAGLQQHIEQASCLVVITDCGVRVG
jgi:hypothetical protein